MAEDKTTKSGIWVAIVTAIGSIVVTLITSGGWFHQKTITNDVQDENKSLKSQVAELQSKVEQLSAELSRHRLEKKSADNSAISDDPPHSPDRPQTEPSPKENEVAGIRFALQQCNASKTAVSCRLLITSPGQDRHITAGSASNGTVRSFMYDQGGAEYRLSQVSMANKIGGEVQTLLVRDIPTVVEVTYDVNADVTIVSLLRFAVGDLDRNIPAVGEFRDIQLK